MNQHKKFGFTTVKNANKTDISLNKSPTLISRITRHFITSKLTINIAAHKLAAGPKPSPLSNLIIIIIKIQAPKITPFTKSLIR